jgi:hypothetical protein
MIGYDDDNVDDTTIRVFGSYRQDKVQAASIREEPTYLHKRVDVIGPS